MSDELPSLFVRCKVIFSYWWEEATGPIHWSWDTSPLRSILRRLLVWTPVFAAISFVALLIGFRVYSKERASDLASKAMENMRKGNWPLARLQVVSADNLRSGDLDVRRSKLFLESKLGDAQAPARWDALAAETSLSLEELEERARSALMHGSPQQSIAALSALEAAGGAAASSRLRSSWHFGKGDLEEAINASRSAVALQSAPRDKLKLATLLAVRHGPAWSQPASMSPADAAAAKEASELVESLRSTPLALDALAFGLIAIPLDQVKAIDWSVQALEQKDAENAALLPAASVAIRQGKGDARRLAWQFSPVFAFAPLPRQAAFAEWLCDHSLWEDALVVAHEKEARQDPRVFTARARALAGMGKWDELLALSESKAVVPQSMLLATRHIAAAESGREEMAASTLVRAVKAALTEGLLAETVRMLDSHGSSEAVDIEVVSACSDPSYTDEVFRLAYERFGRAGKMDLLEQAFARAENISPSAPSVASYRVRTDLLSGRPVDLSQTSAAIRVAPADPKLRFNHTLNLLLAGRPAEAEAVFDDMDVFVDQLSPGDKSIVVAVLRAKGDVIRAERLAATIDPEHLTSGEKELMSRQP